MALWLIAVSSVTGLQMGVTHGLWSPLPENWATSRIVQGDLAQWHWWAAVAWVLVMMGYAAWYRQRYRRTLRFKEVKPSHRYHLLLTRVVWALLIGLALTGSMLLVQPTVWPHSWTWVLVRLHVLLAVLIGLYLVLHVVSVASWRGWQALFTLWWTARWDAKYRRWAGVMLGLTAAIVGLGLWLPLAWVSPSLIVAHVNHESLPEIDGDLNDAVWQTTPAQVIRGGHGWNLDRQTVDVSVKALSDGQTLFMAFQWLDPTPSGAHLPLIKTTQGWKVLQDGFDQNDEKTWYEDKLAVMWSQEAHLATAAFHHGLQPLLNAPAMKAGRGYHYSTSDQVFDVWHWKSVRNPPGNLDDSYFGSPQPAWPAERRYTAGYYPDPSDAGAVVENWLWYNSGTVTPRRLPRDADDIRVFQKKPDPTDPQDNRRWAMSWYDTQPYLADLDNYPVGTLMPSVIIRDPYEGDRADVRAQSNWKNGRWTLEIARSLKTSSRFDVPIQEGSAFWVAVFDHNQARHTLQWLPVILHFESSKTIKGPS